MIPVWSGTISFALVHIPIKLYKATKERRPSFHLLHKSDMSPVKYARICKRYGNEIPYQEIVKGLEYQKSYVVLENEDFRKADAKRTQTIEIKEFVSNQEIDPSLYSVPYYIEAEPESEKSYALFREALRQKKKVAIGLFVLRNKECLVAIRPHKDILILNELRFSSELRSADKVLVPKKEMFTEKELNIAQQIIEQMTAKFKHDEFRDTYAENLKELIRKKAEGKRIPMEKIKIPSIRAIDLMASLKESLEKVKQKK